MTLALPTDLRLSPEQFASVCAANPEAVLEPDADGRLITMTATGFELPDGSVHSPDASLVRLERWQALSEEQRRGSRPCAPIWWWHWPARATAPQTCGPV